MMQQSPWVRRALLGLAVCEQRWAEVCDLARGLTQSLAAGDPGVSLLHPLGSEAYRPSAPPNAQLALDAYNENLRARRQAFSLRRR